MSKRKASEVTAEPETPVSTKGNSTKVAECNRKISKLTKEIEGILDGTNEEFKIRLAAVERRRQKALHESKQNKEMQIQNITRWLLARLSGYFVSLVSDRRLSEFAKQEAADVFEVGFLVRTVVCTE